MPQELIHQQLSESIPRKECLDFGGDVILSVIAERPIEALLLINHGTGCVIVGAVGFGGRWRHGSLL